MPRDYTIILRIVGIAIFAFGFSLLGQDGSAPHPEKVANTQISIADITENSLQPFHLESSRATVLFFVTHDCPISNAYSPELARIHGEFSKKEIKLLLVYVDPDVTPKQIKEHMRDYGLQNYTAIQDSQHTLVSHTGADVTPEAVVVLPDATIAYRGRIDNMYPALGKRRRTITKHELRDALNAILENRPVTTARTKAIGCFIPNL